MKINKISKHVYGISKESYRKELDVALQKLKGLPECLGRMSAQIEMPKPPEVLAENESDAKKQIATIMADGMRKMETQANRFKHCISKCEYFDRCFKMTVADILRNKS